MAKKPKDKSKNNLAEKDDWQEAGNQKEIELFVKIYFKKLEQERNKQRSQRLLQALHERLIK